MARSKHVPPSPGDTPQPPPGSAPFPLLEAAPISHTMPVPGEGGEPDALLLPDAPAVVVFEAAEPPGRTILIATTASARDLARRRLAPVDPKQPRADFRALCAGGRVHAIQVGSSLEADAVYLRQARERLPELARVVAERWRAWFVHVDFQAEFPQWTKTNLSIGLVGKRSASTAIGGGHIPPGVLLGPLPDKDAAGRLIEGVIDCFDLCRYHNLLVQAPNAVACAYKEMGRCPAPCDGSEAMETYRDRTASASALIAHGIGGWMDTCEAVMKEAAAQEDFEKAARIKKDIARMRVLDRPAFAQVRPLHNWQELFVLPSSRRGSATVALFDRGTLFRVADVPIGDAPSAAAACRTAEGSLGDVLSGNRATSTTITPEQIDTIALASRWLFLPKTRRKGDIVPRVDGRFSAEALARVAESLAKAKKTEPDVESQEIEGTE